jgi:hypothetical protein
MALCTLASLPLARLQGVIGRRLNKNPWHKLFLLPFVRFLLIPQILLLFTLKAQKPSLTWAVPLGTNVLSQYNAVDALGNVYITGYAYDTVDFDPGPATYSIAFTENVFLAKYRSNGQLVWARSLGFSFAQTFMCLCADAIGNVYMSGTFSSTINVGPGPPVQTFTATNQDVLILRMDSSGACTWAGSIGSDSYDWAMRMKCDGNNNLFLGGSCGNDNIRTPMDLDPGPGVSNDTIERYSDGYIIKLDPNGNYVWGGLLGGWAYESVSGFDVDAAGNLILAGTGVGGMDIDPGLPVATAPTLPTGFTYLSKFSPTGNRLWTKFWEQNYADARVSIDQLGNIAMLCSYYGTVDVDPGPQTNTISSWKWLDAYVVTLDGMGQFLWSRNWHDSGYIYTGTVETDINNNIYITGTRGNWMDFDPGPGTDTLSGFGSFVIMLDQYGSYKWSTTFKMASTISRPDVKVLNNGDMYISAWYYDKVDLDPGSGIFLDGVPNKHSSALLKLHPSSAVGIPDFEKLSQTDVFPNPSNGEFSLRQTDCNATGSLIIRDVNGRVVSRTDNLSACSSFTTRLPAGVYLCTWPSDGNCFKLVVSE